MHITTPITKSNSKLTTTNKHTDKNNILPLHLKEIMSHKQDDTQALIPLSSQLTRLVDACGDCV